VSLAAFTTLVACGLLLTLLAATGAKVLQNLSWHELEEYGRRRRQRERYDAIHEHADDVAAAVECLQVVATALIVLAIATWLLSPADSTIRWPLVLATTAGTVVVVLATVVWIPQAVARLWSAPFLFHTWRVWRAVGFLLAPLAWGVLLFHTVLRRLAGRLDQPTEEEAFEEEIRSIVSEGIREGLLEADAREMIEGVIELGDADVADIMTPRSQIDAMPVDLQWPDILDQVIHSGRTRIPVYEDKLDHIVGVLYVKDLLPELAKDDPSARRSLREIVRQPWFVPRTNRLNDLLRTFLQTRNHLAVVLDEYMSVAGLVTIEDVLEEIVGEIVDESDKEEVGEIRNLDEHTAEVQGRTHLADVNQHLGVGLPEPDEYDTIAGFVIHQLGRIPIAGESLEWENLRITVLDASQRRVHRVRVEVLGRPARETV